MIKFVIVDDEQQTVDSVKKIISKESMKIEEEIDVISYNFFNKDLEKEIKNTDVKKVYILDIELQKGISGIKIAEKIRKDDWDSEIIFITNHDKMFEIVYRSIYDVFSFIEKFHDFEEKLSIDLSNIFKKNFDNKMFLYSNRSINLRIYFRNILYIYRDTSDRKLYIVTLNNAYIIPMTLQDVMNLLDYRFKFVHRACIVNIEKVEEFNFAKGCFTLETGQTVDMLSKKYKKDLD